MAGRNLLADTPSPRKKGRDLLHSGERDYSQPPGPEAPLNDPAANWASGVADVGRVGVDAFSLGGADYMAGGDQKAQTDAARQRLGPVGSFATEMAAGGLTPMFSLPQKFGKVVGTVGHGLQGGAQSVADAYMHGERDPMALLQAAGIGSGVTGAVSGLTDPVASWWSRRKGREAAKAGQTYKTDDELKAAKDAEYKKVRDAKVVYAQGDLRKLEAMLENMNLVEGGDDALIGLRKNLLKRRSGKDISPDVLDRERQLIREMTSGNDRRKASVGKLMIKGMDRFTKKTIPRMPSASGIGPGVPASKDINDTLLNARKLNTQDEKLARVRKMEAEAKLKQQSQRFAPFGPSPESADVREASRVVKEIDTGKRPVTSKEKAAFKQLSEGTVLRDLGGKAEPFSLRGKFGGPAAVLGASVGLVPGVGFMGSLPLFAGATAMEGLSVAGQRATKREIEDLKYLIRDPKGVGLSDVKADPAAVEDAKKKMAKLLSSFSRATQSSQRSTER